MKNILILSIALLSLASCKSLTPFTENLYQDLDLSEGDLKRVQFYLSEDVVLYRDLGLDEASVNEGKIKLKQGRQIHEVVFKKGTPGALVFIPKENRFAISFDEYDDKFLMFGPNRRLNDKFTLLGKDWEGDVGEITYGGKRYYTSTRSALVGLLVNVNKVRDVNVNRESPSGRTVR